MDIANLGLYVVQCKIKVICGNIRHAVVAPKYQLQKRYFIGLSQLGNQGIVYESGVGDAQHAGGHGASD